MQQADIFIILKEVQFPKNSWTNRCQVDGKWWSNPVEHGLVPIKDKKYTTGQSLFEVNILWILAIAKLLNINTDKIKLDFPTDKKGTERIVEICKHFKAEEYLANPEATLQYLDEKILNDNGIKLIPFVSHHKKHVFEYFNEIGIEKTRALLNECQEVKKT